MSIFISYARADALLVKELHDALTEATHEVWYDHDLAGGEDWWTAILERIRTAEVFIFVLSPDSAASRACRRELAYADRLGRPVIPVMVRELHLDQAPDQVQSISILRFISPTVNDWIRLMTAIQRVPSDVPLPATLPEAPAAPMADLAPAREMADRSSLTESDQRGLVAELRAALRDDNDRPAAVVVLKRMLERRDLLKDVADQIDELLLTYPVESNGQVSPTIRSLVADVKAGMCTPIVGSGMTDWLFGTRRDFARKWAAEYPFGMTPRWTDDLPQIAQYAAVTYSDRVLRTDLASFYRDQLCERIPQVADAQHEKTLGELAVAAYDAESPNQPDEPHRVLAALPCSVFVTAQATSLLVKALEDAGKEPVTDYCRWKPELRRQSKLPLEDPNYVPDPSHPLVYHMLGTIDRPESLVITEDEYFDFLAAVADSDPNSPIIPSVVQEALADTSLLMLGFGLQDWDLRILLRGVIRREAGERKGANTKNVATEMDALVGVRSPNDARDYVVTYFRRYQPSIEIEWATVDQFAARLAAAWERYGGE